MSLDSSIFVSKCTLESLLINNYWLSYFSLTTNEFIFILNFQKEISDKKKEVEKRVRRNK